MLEGYFELDDFIMREKQVDEIFTTQHFAIDNIEIEATKKGTLMEMI